ncbi:uncharacterized protein LOC26514329 isoform X2 [Drosophila ananassae]|uniref:uncharacterized protein LOC26514329 isoform X2 n=1 Tax=Drosophila ananassae TaxID=7217 RepID=UPI001CFFF94D|nr:uncharacterized protein LOC26514329 isoform X2 [Drosophila ananassae]
MYSGPMYYLKEWQTLNTTEIPLMLDNQPPTEIKTKTLQQFCPMFSLCPDSGAGAGSGSGSEASSIIEEQLGDCKSSDR